MEFLRRLWFLWRRERLDRDLQEEMRQHLELKIKENLAAGMAEDEARRRAHSEFWKSRVGPRAHAREPRIAVAREPAPGHSFRAAPVVAVPGLHRGRDHHSRAGDWREHGDFLRD